MVEEKEFAMIIREGSLYDLIGITKVHIESWKTTYDGVFPDEYLDNISFERRKKAWLKVIDSDQNVYVAEEQNGKIVGFSVSSNEKENEDIEFDGRLVVIYLLDEYHGQGIGKKLFKKAAQGLIADGCESMMVWVLKDNASKNFYEALNGELYTTEIDRIADRDYVKLGYCWRDLSVFEEESKNIEE